MDSKLGKAGFLIAEEAKDMKDNILPYASLPYPAISLTVSSQSQCYLV